MNGAGRYAYLFLARPLGRPESRFDAVSTLLIRKAAFGQGIDYTYDRN